MLELTRQQVAVIERLHERGFAIVAFPLYASYVGVRKGNCAALLEPVPKSRDGMRLYGQPSYLVAGNLSARVLRKREWWFVWKKEELRATPERMAELKRFREELVAILEARGEDS